MLRRQGKATQDNRKTTTQHNFPELATSCVLHALIPSVFSPSGWAEGTAGCMSSIPMETSDLNSSTDLSAICLRISIILYCYLCLWHDQLEKLATSLTVSQSLLAASAAVWLILTHVLSRLQPTFFLYLQTWKYLGTMFKQIHVYMYVHACTCRLNPRPPCCEE